LTDENHLKGDAEFEIAKPLQNGGIDLPPDETERYGPQAFSLYPGQSRPGPVFFIFIGDRIGGNASNASKSISFNNQKYLII
jgi:hypothetical protein